MMNISLATADELQRMLMDAEEEQDGRKKDFVLREIRERIKRDY